MDSRYAYIYCGHAIFFRFISKPQHTDDQRWSKREITKTHLDNERRPKNVREKLMEKSWTINIRIINLNNCNLYCISPFFLYSLYCSSYFWASLLSPWLRRKKKRGTLKQFSHEHKKPKLEEHLEEGHHIEHILGNSTRHTEEYQDHLIDKDVLHGQS